MPPIRALSIRQPWAHAILHLGKDVENRGRRSGHRGLTLIHASAAMSVEEYAEPFDFIAAACGATGVRFDVPPMAALPLGGIVGAVEIVDCVDSSESAWWMGPAGLVLRNPRPLPFMPCKGTVAPMCWLPPADVLARAKEALGISA